VPALSEHLDLAGGGGQQPFEDLHRRRLARPVRTKQAEALARGDREVEPRHGDEVAIAFSPVRGIRERRA